MPDGSSVRVSAPYEDTKAALDEIQKYQAEETAKANNKAWGAQDQRGINQRSRTLNKLDAQDRLKDAQAEALWAAKESAERKGLDKDYTAALKEQIRQRTAALRAGNESAKNYFASEKKIQDEMSASLKQQDADRKSGVNSASKTLPNRSTMDKGNSEAQAWLDKAQADSSKLTYRARNSAARADARSNASADKLAWSYGPSRASLEAGTQSQISLEQTQANQINAARARLSQEEVKASQRANAKAWSYGPSRASLEAGTQSQISLEQTQANQINAARAQRAKSQLGVEQTQANQINAARTRAARAAGPSAGAPATDLGTARRQLGIEQTQANQINAAMDRAARAAGSGGSGGVGSLRAFNGLLKETHDGVRGLAGSMGAMWLTWGSFIPLAAGAAIGSMFRDVITTGKDVEYQLAFVSALSGGAVVGVEKFNAAIAGSMVGPVEASKAMRGLAQNGLNVAEALSALPAILALATAGEMDLTQAALGATGVMAAFNLEVSDLGRIGDVFSKAAAISNTSVQGMMEAMKQASIVGDQFHITIEQTAASLAVLAKRNIEGSAAGTALRNMMVELVAPTKKSRDAMAQMNLEVYDANNQLVGYEEILSRLHDVTAGLSEKGKLSFLGDMFGERGAKAVNALLADFDLLKATLITVKTESDGFAQSIVDALGETTQGKVKKLFSEFQIASNKAFTGANDSFKAFLDSIRLFVASDDFKSIIGGITDGVVGLGKAIAQCSDALMMMGAAWVAFKVGGAVVGLQSIQMLVVGAGTLTEVLALLATTGVVALGTALATVAIGLGVVAAVAGAAYGIYSLLSDAVDKDTEAIIANTNALKLAGNEADANLGRLEEELKLLHKRGVLIREGMTVEDAGKAVAAAAEQDNKVKLGSDLGAEKQKLAAVQAQIKKAGTVGSLSGAAGMYVEVSAADKSLLDKEEALLGKVAAAQRLFDIAEKTIITKVAVKANNEFESAAKQLERLNAAIESFNKSPYALKLNKRVEPVLASEADRLSRDGVNRLDAEKRAELSRVGGSYTPHSEGNKDKTAAKKQEDEARRIALAQLAEKEAEYRRGIQGIDAYYKAEEAIVKAREQSKLITVEEYAQRTDDIAKARLKSRLAYGETELSTLEKQQKVNNSHLHPEDKIRLSDKVQAARDELEVLREEVRKTTEVAAIKVAGSLKVITDGGAKDQMEAALSVMKLLRDMAKTANEFSPGLVKGMGAGAADALYPGMNLSGTPSERSEQKRQNAESRLEQKLGSSAVRMSPGAKDASMKAGMQAFDIYQTKIDAWSVKAQMEEVELARLQGEQKTLGESIGTAETWQRAESLAMQMEELGRSAEGVRVKVLAAKKEASDLEKLQGGDVEKTASAARALYQAQITPQAGMQQFWKEYQTQAENTATTVHDVMSQSFNSMQQGLLQFVTTGKLNMKSLAVSVIADAARMMAAKGIQQLLSMGLNFAMSAWNASPTTPGGNSTYALPTQGVRFANGGVMTNEGTLPLKRYAGGGVANTPQLAMYGEGRTPEAYVPLPDGRSIPVTMSGGAGGSQVNVTVNISSDGSSKTESDTSGEKAAQLGKMMEQSVMAVINREKRAGGLLYA
jgi:TP901 family phage tail tape measure protein